MADFIQVFTTVPRREDAERLAKQLVEKRLAGCVQILGPLASTYWWKGRVETSEEWLCLLKSSKALFRKLETAVKQVHPYETPEIIALPIAAGNQDYLAWLSEVLEKE